MIDGIPNRHLYFYQKDITLISNTPIAWSQCGNSLHPPWFRFVGVEYEQGKGLSLDDQNQGLNITKTSICWILYHLFCWVIWKIRAFTTPWKCSTSWISIIIYIQSTWWIFWTYTETHHIPSGKHTKSYWKSPSRKLVDLAIYSMVDRSSSQTVSLPEPICSMVLEYLPTFAPRNTQM